MSSYRFPRVRVVAVILGGVLAVAGLRSPGDNAILLAEGAKASPGSELYGKYCLACHAADGRGLAMKAAMPNMPDFTSSAWHDGRSNPELSVGILEGKGTQMPAFSDRLTNDQGRDLVTLIRAFKKPAANANGQ